MLVHVIEQGMSGRMKVSAATVVASAVALSKLDAAGRTVERIERFERDAEFLDDPRWTMAQMEAFARDGTFPDWYKEDCDTTLREAASSELAN